jgi:hypothetical protein
MQSHEQAPPLPGTLAIEAGRPPEQLSELQVVGAAEAGVVSVAHTVEMPPEATAPAPGVQAAEQGGWRARVASVASRVRELPGAAVTKIREVSGATVAAARGLASTETGQAVMGAVRSPEARNIAAGVAEKAAQGLEASALARLGAKGFLLRVGGSLALRAASGMLKQPK